MNYLHALTPGVIGAKLWVIKLIAKGVTETETLINVF